jgi:hypothetical protein
MTSAPPATDARTNGTIIGRTSSHTHHGGDEHDSLCVICFEGAGDHVVMPCGHGGYCQPCAHKVFVRAPGQCSICRAPIEAVVKVSLDTEIGGMSGVS